MNWSWHTIVAFSVLAAGTMLPGAAVAQPSTGATQVLDRVNAVSPKAVLDMAFDDPAAALPFEAPPEITTDRGFTSCQLTAERGLFCLDQNTAGAPGRFVRRWDPVFRDGEVGNPYFSCESLPGVDTSRGVETCTGITADDNGAVVVAGKRKGGYNLVKVAARADLPNGTCAAPWAPLGSTELCFKVLLPRDRPLLVDVTYAELAFPNDANDKPVQCTGILGLENRTTLMFFTDRDADEKNHPSCATTYAEVTIVGTKGWGLDRGEVLQGVTTLKTKNGASEDSFVLVISSLGRVRAEKTNDSVAAPFQVTISRGTTDYTSVAELRDLRGSGGVPADPCDTSPQEFGIRTSTKSGRLYVSDKNFCEVSSFEPAGDTLVKDGAGLKMVTFNGWDLVLSTKTQPSGPSYPVVEPTLAPGISIDLSKCFSEQVDAEVGVCTLVAGGNGQRLASLSNVKLASTAKGMTLYQVQQVPDCRWISEPKPAACTGAVSGGDARETQYLNITPLLPKEVTDQFAPGELPPMYISPHYRAQETNLFYFELFFGVTQNGVVFQDVFDLEFDVKGLNAAQKELGCVGSPPLRTTVDELLMWDIAVTVSEKVQVVGPTGKPYSDILVNSDCGSTRAGAVRWSAYMYDLELTPLVYGASPNGSAPDDYFAHLVVDLFFDLEAARRDFACAGPLGTAVCSNLESTWLNAKDKLAKCLKDSYAPKTSEAVRNCNSFDAQMANYRATLDTVPLCTVATTTCRDPENRLGELKARVDTLRHVMNDRLIPSVPALGWVDGLAVLDDDGTLKEPVQ